MRAVGNDTLKPAGKPKTKPTRQVRGTETREPPVTGPVVVVVGVQLDQDSAHSSESGSSQAALQSSNFSGGGEVTAKSQASGIMSLWKGI